VATELSRYLLKRMNDASRFAARLWEPIDNFENKALIKHLFEESQSKGSNRTNLQPSTMSLENSLPFLLF
jgi:hypothetical protein